MRRVRQIVPKAVGEEEILRRANAQLILQRWEEVVGSDLASRSWPDGFSQGTVWVAVTGSAWAAELRLRRDMILGRLNAIAGEPNLFQHVRFGQRPLPERPISMPSEPEVDPGILDRQTPLSIQEIAARRLAKRRHESPD